MYEELYDENKSLLFAIAKSYRGLCERDKALDVEDLVHIGFIGLVKATKEFDRQKHKSWAPYARLCIKREILAALKYRDGKQQRADALAISLDSPLLADNPEGSTFGDMLADESLPASDEALLRDEVRVFVQEAMKGLADPRQRRLVEMIDIERRSIKEASAAVGMRPLQARQVYHRALSNLARDKRLRALADIEDNTRYYARKSVTAFQRDNTSVTEAAALWRIEQFNRLKEKK